MFFWDKKEEEARMYVILTYDVHEKRCHKVMNFCRKWLEHRQNSVFAGYLDLAQIRIMTSGLLEIIHPEYDRVIIFKVNRPERVNEWVTDASNLYGIRNFKEHFPDVQEDRPENHQVEIVDKSKKNSSIS